MKENAFFTLPLIGSFIYFVISCLITIIFDDYLFRFSILLGTNKVFSF